jgi:SAM-dependent methyltransferase
MNINNKKIVDYKENKYHEDRHPEFIESELLSLAWSDFAFLEYFQNEHKRNVLEFGGGLGNNLFRLTSKSNVWMIEPSAFGRAFAEKYGVKTATSLVDLQDKFEELFDVILCRHVLEHVESPLETLRQLKLLLKPGGRLVLVLPFEKVKQPVTKEIDFHLYCWTPRTALNLLNHAGFQCISWKYNFFTGKRLFLLVYKLLGAKHYRFSMKALGRMLNSKELLIISN